jgi:hypothetical protein
MEITLKKPLTPRQKRSNSRRQIISAVNKLVNQHIKLTGQFVRKYTRMLYIVDLREAHDFIIVKIFDGAYQPLNGVLANNKELYGQFSYYGSIDSTLKDGVSFTRENNIKDSRLMYPDNHLMSVVLDSKVLEVGPGDLRNAFYDYIKQIDLNKPK